MKWILVYIWLIPNAEGEVVSRSTVINPPNGLIEEPYSMMGCFELRNYIVEEVIKNDYNRQQAVCVRSDD